MTTPRRFVAALALVLSLGVPGAASAQYDLGGFVGTVTLTFYDALAESGSCPDYVCAEAVVASGRGAGGRYFARLVSFDSNFDIDGFNAEGGDVATGFGVSWLELIYADPNPIDPDGIWWYFLNGPAGDNDWRFTTSDHGSPVIPGQLTVGYDRLQIEPYSGEEIFLEKSIALQPYRLDQLTATPEPTTAYLVAIGVAGLVMLDWRRRRRT